MKRKNAAFNILICCLLISLQGVTGQVQNEVNPPENIKTVIFKGPEEGYQFPIIRLGETMRLTFDDLFADEQDYYYRIEHCNADWTPSRLMKTQYLKGLDDQRIIQYENSVATIQPYTHYTLEIPNRLTGLKLTGNYILKIYDGFDKLVFSRRFIVYSNRVNTGVIVKRVRDFDYIDGYQRLEIVINSADFELVNPKKEVKLALIKNSNFDHVITGVEPQFISGNQLIYRYDMQTAFPGGNEYYNFDTKELRVANNSVARVELGNRYYHYLFTNQPRKDEPYTYFPDINGDFTTRTLNAVLENPATEADYSFVTFSLTYDPTLAFKDIYVYGKFNNYRLEESNRLKLNEDNTYTTTLLLKQGFYNYKYVIKNEDGTIDHNALCGNFWPTENEYLAIVYYRNFGDIYDSVIGLGNASSLNISN
ncbi:type IX secretion system plug protein domain-containing protein [Robertkochia aurantiaca]|uniref:type IX secretion system plug protein n=1 Tax=Robertkochia aurantiaca TaxID=2873700 RepID=UPI001CCA53E5|nr:type IX secretion system plug protein domain-containing protein [Robertkochia sp. 3YJGBD-33]